jgi:hypothetical protein
MKHAVSSDEQVKLWCVGSFIYLHRETEEKARQPEIKLSAIAQTRHIAGLRDAKRSRTRNPKPTHGARDRPKQPQPRAGRDRASEPGRRHASRRTRPPVRDVRARLYMDSNHAVSHTHEPMQSI